MDFVERFSASPEIYLAVSRYVAERCDTLRLKHFSAQAVTGLLRAMHRWVEDQARIGTNYSQLETLVIESAAVSPLSAPLVELADVDTALKLRLLRHQHNEKELRDSITDGELMQGVRYRAGGATTHSLVMRGRSGTIRSIHSEHKLSKLRAYADVDFEH